MSNMNALLATGYRAPDPVNAFARGADLRAGMDEQRRQGEMRNALAQYGGAAMQGDQNAINALAQYDPKLAYDLHQGQRQDARAEAELGMSRERLNLARESAEAQIASSQQQAKIAAAEWAAKVDAAEIARAKEVTDGLINKFTLMYQAGPDVWARGVVGTELEETPYEEALIDIAQLHGTNEGLMEAAKPKEAQSPPGKVAADVAAGILSPEAAATAGDARASLNPIWGTDASGNAAVVQLADDGRAIPTQFPQGFQPNKATDRIDAGTEWILLDPVTRAPVGRIPKNNMEAASQTAQGRVVGEAVGAAAAGLPAQHEAMTRITAAGEDILNDPNLASVLGPVDSRLPRFTQERADTQAKIDRFIGQTFPMAMESLRGLGPASEMEGMAAQRAIANLDQAQGPEQFQKALREAMDHIRRGFEIAQQKAGGLSIGGSAPPQRLRFNPDTGEIE